jgi:hypothetical protein
MIKIEEPDQQLTEASNASDVKVTEEIGKDGRKVFVIDSD